MLLDMRTTVFLTMVFELFFGIGMIVFNKHKTSFQGVNYIGVGFLLTGFGFVLMFYRDFISSFFSVVVCNTLILGGVILTLRGLLRFYRKQLYHWVYDGVGLFIFALSFIYFLYFDSNINMRVVIICAYLIIYYALILYLIVHKPTYDEPAANGFISVMLVVLIAFYVFRIGWTLFEDEMTSFMLAGNVHGFAVAAFAIWPIVLSFSVFTVMNSVTHGILEQQANVDSLTNLYNRRAISEVLRKSPSTQVKDMAYAAYVLCDIDKFKDINDNYGHGVGDLVLKTVAEFLERNTRSEDVVVRYGGDEFFMFFPNTIGEVAVSICEKLRKNISEVVIVSDKTTINITMSFGIHMKIEGRIDCRDCIDMADKALYMAKEKGRNCVAQV